MRRMIVAALALSAAAVLVGTALAAPKGAVPGRFTVGLLAGSDQLSSYMKASNVWCVWKGDNVIVHVNMRNTGNEHVTATVKPRYTIARGGEHGSGFSSAEDYGFDGGEFRSLWIDAGSPKGVRIGAKIASCSPYLFLIKSG